MSQSSSKPPSQLRRLIAQARKTRTVNDMFRFGPVPAVPIQGDLPSDLLLLRLGELETDLFETPANPLPVEDLLAELEQIGESL